MNLLEIQELVMFQTNNDKDDLGDFTPHLTGYVNEGYDRLLYAYDKKHLGAGPALIEGPELITGPEWIAVPAMLASAAPPEDADDAPQLPYADDKEHLGEDPAPLADADDVPQLPLWTHHAIADWATWLVYRNGNPQKQSRGFQYRAAFDEVLRQVTASGGRAGAEKPVTAFYNIP